MNFRVHLEPLGQQHAERVQLLASDPAIAATTNVPSPYPDDGAVTFIAHVEKCRMERTLYVFAIVSPSEGLVGVCSLLEVDLREGTAVVGYWVGHPYWGRGFATEAGHLLLDFGFRELGLRFIGVHCLADNLASARVIEKLGFVSAGAGPAEPRGPTLAFTLTPEEWIAASAQGDP